MPTTPGNRSSRSSTTTVVTACPPSWSDLAIRNGSRRLSRRTSWVRTRLTSGQAGRDPRQPVDGAFDVRPQRTAAKANGVVRPEPGFGGDTGDLAARLVVAPDGRRVKRDGDDLRRSDEAGHALVELDE